LSTSSKTIVTIYFTVLDQPLTTDKLHLLLHELPPFLHERILRFRLESDQQLNLLAYLLLQKALCLAGYPKNRLECLRISDHGKPFIPDSLHFNLSHAHNISVCAVSREQSIGLDVEGPRKICLERFQDLFPSEIWQDITAAPEPEKRFISHWTRLESVLKAAGLGFKLDPAEVIWQADQAQVGPVNYTLFPLELPWPYIGHIALISRHCTMIYQPIKIQELGG